MPADLHPEQQRLKQKQQVRAAPWAAASGCSSPALLTSSKPALHATASALLYSSTRLGRHSSMIFDPMPLSTGAPLTLPVNTSRRTSCPNAGVQGCCGAAARVYRRAGSRGELVLVLSRDLPTPPTLPLSLSLLPRQWPHKVPVLRPIAAARMPRILPVPVHSCRPFWDPLMRPRSSPPQTPTLRRRPRRRAQMGAGSTS